MDRDVGDHDFVFFDSFALHAVVDHDVTERTRRSDAAGAGCQQLLGALDIDVLAGVFFHPEASATSTTAHRLGAVLLGFENLHTTERTDHLAWSEVDVVVAAEVAGVVVDDALVERCVGHVEVTVFDQVFEELAVMDHFVVATELWVLVCEGVKAVRALGDDLLDAHAIERLDVLHREKLEDVLVAGTASRVPGAVLRRPKNCEAHVGSVEQFRQRLADLLVLVVERTGTTNPVEVLGFQRVGAVDDLDVGVLGPVGALTLAEGPRVHLVFHAAISVAELGREVRLHQREVAAHIENLVEDLDLDRADLVTCTTRRARPKFFAGDTIEHPVRRDGDLGINRKRRRYLSAAGSGHDLAGFENDLARVERLAGGVGWAHAGAATAHGAGVGVEELFPGELFDLGDTEGFLFGFEQVRHGLHRALRAILFAQVHVERRGEDVTQHRGRQKNEEHDERHDVGDPPTLMPTSE